MERHELDLLTVILVKGTPEITPAKVTVFRSARSGNMPCRTGTESLHGSDHQTADRGLYACQSATEIYTRYAIRVLVTGTMVALGICPE